ncbi:hypothetical protein [Bacillus testis]|uniref:hypothetical protein n=1 Tax=Bacillus testis TaxID=1622072 RepID=UPI00067F5755|nr:hypothetical protein [Bacillus testis]
MKGKVIKGSFTERNMERGYKLIAEILKKKVLEDQRNTKEGSLSNCPILDYNENKEVKNDAKNGKAPNS